MIIRVLLVAVFTVLGHANAQQLAINSTTYYGGTNVERIQRIIPTADRGFLAVGTTNSQNGNFPTHFSQTFNALITKHDSNGTIQWAKVFGGSDLETAHAATQTADGGYAIACVTGSYDGDVPARIGAIANTSDTWVLRLDASGNLLWSKVYGSSLSDPPTDIIATPDGGLLMLIVSGGSDSDAVGFIGPSLTTDWILIKTDGQGNRQWRRTLGGTDFEDMPSHLFNAPGGGYYLVGGALSHDSSLREDNLWPGGVDPKYGPVFLKLSDSGQVEWCKRYGGSTPCITWGALFDPSDTTLVAFGQTNSDDYYFTGNHRKQNGQRSEDMFLVKVNKNGELVFSKLLGTSNDEYGMAVARQPNGSYLIAGDQYPGPNGGKDVRVFLASALGDSLLTRTFGAASHDEARGVLASGNGWLIAGVCTNPPFTQSPTGSGGHPQGNIFVSKVEYWPTSIVDPSDETNATLRLAPNPAREEVICYLPFTMSGKLSLFSSGGKLVFEERFQSSKKMIIALSELPVGVYSVVVEGIGHGRWSAQLTTQ